jgi:hypothetical protein
MKYSHKYSANSPLYAKLRSIYALKKQINNAKLPLTVKKTMMNQCDCEINQAWRNHYAGIAGYELTPPRPIMKNINTVLRKEYNVDDIHMSTERLECTNASMIFLVMPPHDNMKKWLLRIAPRCTFDRWANSTVIEQEFDNVDCIVGFLQNAKMLIFNKILNSLSNEVVEMKREMEENA